jgi:hypothetical protein
MSVGAAKVSISNFSKRFEIVRSPPQVQGSAGAVDARIWNAVDVPNYIVFALLPETIFDGVAVNVGKFREEAKRELKRKG